MKVETIYSSFFIDEVIQHNVNRNLIRYTLFMKFVMGQTDYLLEREMAEKAYAQSKKIPTGALAAIFSDPTFSYWIYLSSCIQKRIENGEEVPDSDIPYLLGVNSLQAGRGLFYHLKELTRFLFAAAMLSRTNLKGQVVFLEDKFYLPILGIYIPAVNQSGFIEGAFWMEGNRAIFELGGQVFSDFDQALFLAERGVEQINQPQVGVFIQPSVLGSAGKIILDRVDPYLRLAWSTLYKNPDSSGYLHLEAAEMDVEMPVILAAYKLIYDFWPEIEQHISSSIRSVHLVRSPHQDRHMSCTSEQFFGSILTSTGDEYQVAEALVHEYSHNLLNMVILSGEVFDGPIPKEEIHYSPWREDPRHISGVLHAVFVFTNVSELLDRLSKSAPEGSYLTRRKLDNLIRLRMGMAVLKAFPFTKPLGLALISDLGQKVERLERSYQAYDFSASLAVQGSHLNTWLKKNEQLNIPAQVCGLVGLV